LHALLLTAQRQLAEQASLRERGSPNGLEGVCRVNEASLALGTHACEARERSLGLEGFRIQEPPIFTPPSQNYRQFPRWCAQRLNSTPIFLKVRPSSCFLIWCQTHGRGNAVFELKEYIIGISVCGKIRNFHRRCERCRDVKRSDEWHSSMEQLRLFPFSSGLRKLAVMAAAFPAKRDDCQGLEVPLAIWRTRGYCSRSSQARLATPFPVIVYVPWWDQRIVKFEIKLSVNSFPRSTAPGRCDGPSAAVANPHCGIHGLKLASKWHRLLP